MSRPLFRRVFAILFALAFFSASTLQVMPGGAMPMNADMTVGMSTMGMSMAAHDGTPDAPPMPCKGMTPACMTDFGCVFMVAVPVVPAVPLVVHLAWASITYRWPSAEIADGRIQAPDLRPPIRLI